MTTASDAENSWRAEDAFYYQATNRPLSEAVVRAVAEVSNRDSVGTDPEDGSEPLDPLYETIDPDALDALFRDPDDEPQSDTELRTGTVEFAYCGYDVTVRATGLVTVADRQP